MIGMVPFAAAEVVTLGVICLDHVEPLMVNDDDDVILSPSGEKPIIDLEQRWCCLCSREDIACSSEDSGHRGNICARCVCKCINVCNHCALSAFILAKKYASAIL